MICLPGKSFIPWCEVPIEEVAEDFEGFQEGFEVGRRLLVIDAQVDCLLQGLQKDTKSEDALFWQISLYNDSPVQSSPR